MHPSYKEKIIREMVIRGWTEVTQQKYYYAIDAFMRYFKGKRPNEIGLEEVKNYCYYLKSRGQSHSWINAQMCAIRFFFRSFCKPKFNVDDLPRLKKQYRLPKVFTREEVMAIISCAGTIKEKAMLSVLYSAGLRVKELIYLKVSDIDSKQMLIHIRNGKGGKQRYVPLSNKVLVLLREYMKVRRKPKSIYLFPGFSGGQIQCISWPGQVIRRAKKRAKIKSPGSCHSLRHSFASHHLEDGTDIRTLQVLLGHNNILSTCVYVHVSKRQIAKTISPFDRI